MIDDGETFEKIEHKSELDLNINEGFDPNESNNQELTINTNDFNQKIEMILGKLSDFLQNNKKTVKLYFKDIIYIHEVSKDENYEAIPLQNLLMALDEIGIKIDTIGMYCLFAKLKFNDEYESIDANLLAKEMEKFGIKETNGNNEIKEENEITIEYFFSNLGNFLIEKKMKIIDFLKGKSSSCTIENQIYDVVKLNVFIETMKENNIISNLNVPKKILRLFCDETYEYVILKSLKSKLELFFKKSKKNKKDVKNLNPEDLDQVWYTIYR